MYVGSNRFRCFKRLLIIDAELAFSVNVAKVCVFVLDAARLCSGEKFAVVQRVF